MADLLRVVAVPPYGVTLTVTREPIREHAARYHLFPATLVPDFTKTRPVEPLVAGYVPDVTYDGNCAALGWVLSGPDTTLRLPPLNLATAMFPRCVPVSVELIRSCHDRPRRTSGLQREAARARCLGAGDLRAPAHTTANETRNPAAGVPPTRETNRFAHHR